jgi:hypothetical protein
LFTQPPKPSGGVRRFEEFTMRLTKSSILAIGAVLLLASIPAFAQGDTAGTAASGLVDQFGSFAQLLLGAAFLGGIGCGITAFLKFRGHAENPQQVPLKQPLVWLFVSVCLIAFPAALSMGKTSIFASGQSNSVDGNNYDSIGN